MPFWRAAVAFWALLVIGDYTTAAAAVIISKESDKCKQASIAMTNLADTSIFATEACKALEGSNVDAAAIKIV